ncbi:MAG: hypothetical protein AB7F89_15635 [Pirellulaceae bacterium]
MSFDDRLHQAIQRGQRLGQSAQDAARASALTEDELRRRHGQYRLQLSEHIEQCLRKLPSHFPGFSCEIIYGERGWGAACARDDVRMEAGRRFQDYSRLEMTVRPYSTYHVVELTAKATIRNKELFNRAYFERIEDANLTKFIELIDLWVLEYAELYAARG